MSIEELATKYTRLRGAAVYTCHEAIRGALTKQAETHALELRAYEATVQNLEQRIREIEAQRVPEKVECGCGDIYPASQFMCANCLAAVGAADELRRVDDAQSVPVVGEPDCYDAGLLCDFGGGNVEWWQDYIRAELARAHDFYASQWPVAITAAELDELRKDAERYRWLRMKGAHSDAVDKVHMFGPQLDTAIDAAIAQEGE